MRFVLFMLGGIATVLLGFFGWLWLLPSNAQMIQKLAESAGIEIWIGIVMPPFAQDYSSTVMAGVMLLTGTLLAAVGCLFVLLRRGLQGAVLMLVAALGAAIPNPEVGLTAANPLVLLFTWPLILVALVCLSVRPISSQPAPLPVEAE